MSHIQEGEILICREHPEYQVPMIWTFKFPGAEYWCPYCGKQEGMMEAGIVVATNPEINARGAKYKKLATPFLSSITSKVDWKYERKAEDI